MGKRWDMIKQSELARGGLLTFGKSKFRVVWVVKARLK
jgi:hypothetical protein